MVLKAVAAKSCKSKSTNQIIEHFSKPLWLQSFRNLMIRDTNIDFLFNIK